MTLPLPAVRPRRSLPTLAAVLLLSLAVAACGARGGSSPGGCAVASSPCLQGSAVVALETSRGPVQITLDGSAAPLTAGNFVDLVRRGVYNGTVFHRVVREPTPFVVQGGDPASADPKTPASAYGTGSFLDPASGEARLIPLELKVRTEKEPRYGEPYTSSMASRDLQLTHQRGAVAMARSGDPNSASSQFYVALEALPELDGRYAVFGRVTRGMDVIDRIRQGDRLVRAQVVSGGKLVKGRP
ncbi:MAG: peptidylprolyl isomerase [Synechococcaceae cyanobacterium]|nr:peptidylprolyl isomerase [Synechococcaceae cyanobacterium]